MSSALTTRNLKKIYEDGALALRGIDLEINLEGRVVGIMGPNGAGKTTLVRIASTQLRPTSGEMRVLGYDVVEEAHLMRRRISSLPQDMRPFFYTTTPREDIYHILRMRGIPAGEGRKLAEETIDRLDLGRWADTRVGNLSGGNIKKYLISLSLSPPVDLYLLDEPTSGLDPVSRRKVWSLILDKAKDGAGVIVTSHLLEDLMSLSHEVVFISEGRVIDVGSPAQLVRKYVGDSEWKLVVRAGDASEVGTGALKNALSGMEGIKWVSFQDSLNVYPKDNSQLRELEDLLESMSVRFRRVPVSLEDAYLIVVLGRDEFGAGRGS